MDPGIEKGLVMVTERHLHPYTHTASSTRPGEYVAVAVLSYDGRLTGSVDERVFLVYADDEEAHQLCLEQYNLATHERCRRERLAGNQFCTDHRDYEAGWIFTITPNPAGPFAFAVYYCNDDWLNRPYHTPRTRYCKMSKLFGTWEEAVTHVEELRRQDKEEHAKDQKRGFITPREKIYYEIRRLPIMGTPPGGVVLARFDALSDYCTTEEINPSVKGGIVTRIHA